MILQNKPTTLSINTPQTVTLNVSELSSSISGTVSAYESNSANWKVVEFIYKNDTQIKRLIFRLNKSLVDYSLTFNEYSLLGNFECVKIRIEDYQADSVIIKRDQFASLFGSTALFDIGVVDEQVDVTSPTIIAVTPPANGNYSTGQILTYTFTFSEPVLVTGTPTANVVIGSTPKTFAYINGSNSNTLLFRYTVQSDDADNDGITIFSPISLPGGATIKDVAGNNAVLTFFSASATGVTVNNPDNSNSSITQIYSTTTSPVLPANTFNVRVVYQPEITITNPSNLKLNIVIGSTNKVMDYGSHVNITAGTTEISFDYIVQSGDLDTDGVVVTSLDLNGATIVNQFSGNAANNSFTAVNTGVNIGSTSDPYQSFEVLEIEGFDYVLTKRTVREGDAGVALYVVGRRPTGTPSSQYIRTYRIQNMPDNTISITIPFVIRENEDDIIAFEEYRSENSFNVVGSTVAYDLYFRARNTSNQRKLFKWNYVSGQLTQISNINPSGEDLPEAITYYGGKIYFAAIEPINNVHWFYAYDTQTGQTVQVNTYAPGIGTLVNPHDMVMFPQQGLFFIADEAIGGGAYKRRLFRVQNQPSPSSPLVTRVLLPDDVSPIGYRNFATDGGPYPPYNTYSNRIRPKTLIADPALSETGSTGFELYVTDQSGIQYLLKIAPITGDYIFTVIYSEVASGILDELSLQPDALYFKTNTPFFQLFKRSGGTDPATLILGITPTALLTIIKSTATLYLAGAIPNAPVYSGLGLVSMDTFGNTSQTAQYIKNAYQIPVYAGNYRFGGTDFTTIDQWLYFAGGTVENNEAQNQLFRVGSHLFNIAEPVFSLDGLDLSENVSFDNVRNLITYGNKVFFTCAGESTNYEITRLFYVRFPPFN